MPSRRTLSSNLVTTGYHYKLGALESLDDAAARLATGVQELAARCERDAERHGDVAVAYLNDGVVAIQTGGDWRFRFPEDASVRCLVDAGEKAGTEETPR